VANQKPEDSMNRPPPIPAHVIRRLEAERWERKRQDAIAAEKWIRVNGTRQELEALADQGNSCPE